MLLGVHAHLFPGFVQPLKGNHTVDFGIKGIVFAEPNVIPGMNLGPFLPHDNIACPYMLAAKPLDAESLPGTVSAVSGTPSRLFVCHVKSPPKTPETSGILDTAPICGAIGTHINVRGVSFHH